MNSTVKNELDKLLNEFEDAVWCSRSESTTQSTAASIRAIEASKGIKALFAKQDYQARDDENAKWKVVAEEIVEKDGVYRAVNYLNKRSQELAQAKEMETKS